MKKVNLKALTKDEVEAFINSFGLPAYRARQLIHWIYKRYAPSIDNITEFSKDLREMLSDKAYISNLEILKRQISSDGTEKFLFSLEDGESIESVLIHDDDRLTLCISSQVGCALGCKFCLTGTMKLRRNLKAHEIIDQIISVARIIQPSKITNIVLMGMGEPLSNFDEVVESLWRMTGYMGISKRRITLSTSGIAEKIPELAEKAPKVNLAVSLNATTDEARNKLMPINRKFPLEALINACRRFPLDPGRKITFEYVMLDRVNDSLEDSRRLVKLLRGIRCKVNLIPFNPYKGSEFRRPSDEKVLNFQNVLLSGKIAAFIRKSKGQDILAACGQLKGAYKTC